MSWCVKTSLPLALLRNLMWTPYSGCQLGVTPNLLLLLAPFAMKATDLVSSSGHYKHVMVKAA
eukprot:1964888-Amphidinium_carterae.2